MSLLLLFNGQDVGAAPSTTTSVPPAVITNVYAPTMAVSNLYVPTVSVAVTFGGGNG